MFNKTNKSFQFVIKFVCALIIYLISQIGNSFIHYKYSFFKPEL